MKFPIARLTRCLASAAAFACCALAAAFHPAQAQAQAQSASSNGYYTYTLSGVTLNDYAGSGTVSGYFDYDPTTNTLGTYDIATSNGTNYWAGAFSGTQYTAGDVALTYASDDYLAFATGGNDPALLLGFDNLTGSGTYDVDYALEGIANSSMTTLSAYRSGSYFCCGTDGTLVGTPMAGGNPAAVPELSPAAAIGLMSLLGLGALGFAGAKRRRSDDAAA